MNMAIEGVAIAKGRHEICLQAILAIKPDGPTDPDPLDPDRALGSDLAAARWSKYVPDAPNLVEAFRNWGFHTYATRGELVLDFFHCYIGTVVAGEEKELFEAIAPFVVPSVGYRKTGAPVVVTVADEDGHWRYIFKDGKIRTQRAVITWEDV